MTILATSLKIFLVNHHIIKQSTQKIKKHIVLLYMKNISKTITEILKPFGIKLTHKLIQSFYSILCRLEDITTKEDKWTLSIKKITLNVRSIMLEEVDTFIYMNYTLGYIICYHYVNTSRQRWTAKKPRNSGSRKL